MAGLFFCGDIALLDIEITMNNGSYSEPEEEEEEIRRLAQRHRETKKK